MDKCCTFRCGLFQFFFLFLWFMAPPPTWAEPTNSMSPINHSGCLTSDPDFPVDLRGNPDPVNPRFSWELPHSPFDTHCGYLDRDGDGLLDWAEAELAWAFRPYLQFDNDEADAGNDTLSSVNGIHLIYQIHPLAASRDTITFTGPAIRLIRVRFVLLFREDLTHAGDSEVFELELISRDVLFQKWKIHSAQWRRCTMESWDCWWIWSWADYLAPDQIWNSDHECMEDSRRLYCDAPGCTRDIEPALEAQGHTEHGEPCHESLGFCLPTIHVSKGKHGLYVSQEACESCYHGFSLSTFGEHEYCGGGWSGPSCLGLPGAMKMGQGLGYPGFLRTSQYYMLNGIRDEKLITSTSFYLGNIGEIQYKNSLNTTKQITINFSLDNSPSSGPIGSVTRNCTGSETEIQNWFGTLTDLIGQSYEILSIETEDVFADPDFLFYPTPPTLEPPSIGCRSGAFSMEDPLGSLQSIDVINSLVQISRASYPAGIYGLYANFDNEGVLDYGYDRFCGGKRNSPDPNCDAAPLRKIFKRLPLDFNASLSCLNEGGSWFSDLDQDGAPDLFDCEPLHPHLQWDIDQDGICDLPLTLGEVAACQAVCHELYPIVSHGNESCLECFTRCQATSDNCSPLISRFGVPYYDQNEASQCRSLMQKFDGALLTRCQRWFQNPDQADHNQNGVGDHCERRISDVRVDIRSDTYGMNQGFFSWCPDPTATVSAVLSNDREMGPSSKEMLSVGLCVCPGQTEASCRSDSSGQLRLHCPSLTALDNIDGNDYSTKDFAFDISTGRYKYFYHPVKASSTRDLGVLTTQDELEAHVDTTTVRVPTQELLVRWRDAIFQGTRIFLTFRTDRFREFPQFLSEDMLETIPGDPIVSTHDHYSKLKFSSPQVTTSIPTEDDWNPESPTVEYDLIHVPPGMFSYDPEEDDLCVHFPRPVGQPVGYAEGSPLPVDPLWDPPRDLLDPLFGWIPDEDGAWRLFGVDPASFQVRSYVALPSGLDLREIELRFLRVDAALVGGDPGTWSTVAAALDRGTLYLRDPLQPGAWTQVPTGIPANQVILAFHQATSETAWVISRRNLITAPTLQEVHLGSGSILHQQTLPDWTFVRVESLAAPRMGEAYFLLRRPAHLLPNLWKLDKDGLRGDLALPALVPPDRGALAVDGRMGKLYLVARASTDRKASLWVHDLVTKTWSRLSAAVPLVVLREPRLALAGDRLVFSDLKDGRWWEWTQGRWVELGNPLTREVGP